MSHFFIFIYTTTTKIDKLLKIKLHVGRGLIHLRTLTREKIFSY